MEQLQAGKKMLLFHVKSQIREAFDALSVAWISRRALRLVGGCAMMGIGTAAASFRRTEASAPEGMRCGAAGR